LNHELRQTINQLTINYEKVPNN